MIVTQRRKLLYLFAILLFVASCTPSPRFSDRSYSKTRSSKQPKKFKVGQTWTGKASWYGPNFHGKKCANGEVFNMNGISAAHKELPFGTILKVTNLGNGRSCNVRINDRGPFIRGRMLDLSKGAAKKLGSLGDGVIEVKVKIVSLSEN